MAREGDGDVAGGKPDGAPDAGEAPAAAPTGEEEAGIPEPAGLDGFGFAEDSHPPDMPAEPASWQDEMAPIPLPGEAGATEPGAAAAAGAGSARKRRERKVPDTKGDAPDTDAAAPAPQDGPPAAEPDGGRGSEWL